MKKSDWWFNAMHEIEGFQLRFAQNEGYRTLNMAVPIDALLDSIKDTIEVTFAPKKEEAAND